MVTPELLEYIKIQVAAGAGLADIEKILLENKWPQADVAQALAQFTQPVVAEKPMVSNPEIKDKSPLQLSFANNQPWWKNFKIWLISLGVLVGMVLVGGGVWAYVNIYNAPERTVVKSLQALAGVNNVTYSGQIKIETGNSKNDNNALLKTVMPALNDLKLVDVFFNGVQDFSAVNKKGLVKFEANGKNSDNNELLGLGAETRLINSSLYVMLLKANFSQPGLDLSSLTNQWVKFDLAAEGEDNYFKKLTEDATNSNSLEALSVLKLSAADWLNLAKAYYQTKPLNIKKLSNEKIDGMDVYHFSWQLNEAGLKEFAKNIYDVVVPVEQKTAAHQAQYLESLNKPLAGSVSGELWIAKDNSLLRRLSFKYVDKVDSQQSVSALVDMSYNTAVSIDEPTPFKTVEEIFSEWLGNMAKNSPQETINLSLDSDNDGLTDEEEFIFGTDKNQADTDGDGYNDKQEIEGGYNPLGTGKLDQ